jgi:hypothetical protein
MTSVYTRQTTAEGALNQNAPLTNEQLDANFINLNNDKEPAIAPGTIAQYLRGDKTWQALSKSSVGLGNVDNTSDASKSVLSATKLTTSRTINGIAFDGSANISVPVGWSSVTGKPGVIAAGATQAAARAEIGAINEAPSDGKTYGRKDGAWVEGGGSGLSPGDVLTTARTLAAPDWLKCDGSVYLRASYPAVEGLLPPPTDGITWTQRTLPASAYWYAVTYGNGVFVAVAYSNTIAATSPDGITWTQSTLPTNANWLSVTYGNGVFVAVASGGTIAATSPDGITWTQRTLPTNANWQSVTYGNGVFVAVAYGSSIAATSPDGITWTQRTLPANANWYSVTYGNGVFVAVAYGSSIAATSPDGITWTQRTLPANANWYSVTYGNGVFVAVAYSNTIAATSPDGITWTQSTLPTNANWLSVTYGNGVFVAVAYGSSIAATSPDGITWTQRTLPASVSWLSVTYGNGVFVAVAYNNTIAATSSGDLTKFRVPSIVDRPSLTTYIKATA